MAVEHVCKVARSLSGGSKTIKAVAIETGIDYDTVRKILLRMRDCGFAKASGAGDSRRGIKPTVWTITMGEENGQSNLG